MMERCEGIFKMSPLWKLINFIIFPSSYFVTRLLWSLGVQQEAACIIYTYVAPDAERCPAP